MRAFAISALSVSRPRTSESGRSRHFDRGPATSDLPRGRTSSRPVGMSQTCRKSNLREWRHLAQSSGRYRQCRSAGGAPTPPLQRRDGRRALSRKPGNRLTPVRRATRPTTGHKKTGPMCISRRLLAPCAHGAGLIVAAFSARDILRCVKLTSDGGRDTAAALACGKPRAYFFIFLVFLATFLVALAVFFAFFAFFAMSSSWGWLA